jgi:hypothetical protein
VPRPASVDPRARAAALGSIGDLHYRLSRTGLAEITAAPGLLA